MSGPPRRLLAMLGALFALSLCTGTTTVGAQQDPALRQKLDRDQAIANDGKVLSTGHIDVGPKFVDSEWKLMVHDDTAVSIDGGPSVWRHPERTVIHITDDAVRQVPDDPTYAFLRAEPGADVYVVPETQDLDVAWVGWNVQDPEVMDAIDRGVRMTLTGVQGPGTLVVYLQSGDFSEPQLLWDSAAEPKEIFVPTNTHSHANWVFSDPGVYLARIEIEADLRDGSTVVDTQSLRFAVGSDTSTDDALRAAWEGDAGGATMAGGAETEGAQSDDDDASGLGLALAIALAALGLAGAIAFALRRGSWAKRRAREGGE